MYRHRHTTIPKHGKNAKSKKKTKTEFQLPKQQTRTEKKKTQ